MVRTSSLLQPYKWICIERCLWELSCLKTWQYARKTVLYLSQESETLSWVKELSEAYKKAIKKALKAYGTW